MGEMLAQGMAQEDIEVSLALRNPKGAEMLY